MNLLMRHDVPIPQMAIGSNVHLSLSRVSVLCGMMDGTSLVEEIGGVGGFEDEHYGNICRQYMLC